MRTRFLILFLLICSIYSEAAVMQDSIKKTDPSNAILNPLKFNLSKDGSSFFQAVFLNQTWLRYNQSNDSTTVFNQFSDNTFDIGLRRTRMQLFGQIDNRTFLYFQFGQNNFNNAYNYSSNRKLAAFMHDALCEYKVFKTRNWLKIGGGLTIVNGLSRFSQPSVGTIMTLDVPVFLQYSVDQIDQFDRRLAIYARGQLNHLDYRFYISNPFPVNSNGASAPVLSRNASFVNINGFPQGKSPGISHQFGGYLSYNFFENEVHTTPYMTGTYLGARKIFNISAGAVYQKNAMWYLKNDANGIYSDTTLADMLHLGIETFVDMPINKVQKSMINFQAGYYNTNYGYNYLRYNGIMNPATGGAGKTMIQSGAYGNAYPMFGTGQVIYSQLGWLMPANLLGEANGQLMPYMSVQYSDLQALNHQSMLVFNAGLNWLIKGHNSKLTLNYESRPTFHYNSSGDIKSGSRKNGLILQYQIMI